jgi:phosphate transport system substrate-binding protein
MHSVILRLLLVTLSLLMCGSALTSQAADQTGPSENTVRVSGPDSVMGRTRVLAKIFMNTHPAIKVEFVETGLVDAGIAALLDKKSDVAMASRRLSDAEEQTAVKNGLSLNERLVGCGGIVIVTNPANEVNELSVDQVRKIFSGEYTRWNEVGGKDAFIEVVRQDATNHPGTLVFFQDEVLRGAPFAAKAATVATFPAVMNQVAKNPQSIGYVRIRDALESSAADKDKVKILKIKRGAAFSAVAPSRETIADVAYPLRRPYYLYHADKVGSDAGKFVEFMVTRGWGRQEM